MVRVLKVGGGTSVSRDEMLSRAAALVPTLLERAEETEQLRRLPDATVEDLHRTGLWRILQPASRGGGELDYGMLVETPMELARGCASTAWVHTNLASHHWMMAMWPAEAQDEVWDDDPDTLIGSALIYPPGKVERVGGGYKLTGRWPFSSGIDCSDWVMLGGMVPPESGDGAPAPHIFVVRKADIEVIDTWHVAGLSGSGSKDVACDALFIPAHMAVATSQIRGGPTPGAEVNPGPLYRISVLGLFPHILAGPIVGIASGAYEDYVDRLRTTVSKYNRSKLADHVSVQMNVAEVGVLLDGARLLMRENCAEAHRIAEAGGIPTIEDKTRWRRDASHAAAAGVKAMDIIYGAVGGGGNYLRDPMQLRFRDVHAATAQIQVSWDINAPEFGRVTLGLPPVNQNI